MGSLVRNANIDNAAAGLLIIQGKGLDVAHDLVVLNTANDVTHRNAGQERIFARVLEQPAISRIPREIDAAADRLIVALRTELTSNDVSISMRSLRIPRRGGRQHGRQQRRVAALRGRHSNPNSRVPLLHGRYAGSR